MARRVFLYGVYPLLLIATLLYLRFPAEPFRLFCERQLAAVFPGWSTARIDTIDFQPPASIVAGGVGLSGTFDGETSSLYLDRLTLTATGWPPHRALLVTAELYGGRFRAELALPLPRIGAGELVARFSLAEVDLGRLSTALLAGRREIVGHLGLSGSYQAAGEQPPGGRGSGRLQLGAGKFSLLEPVLSLTAVSYSRVEAAVVFAGGDLQLAGGVLRGGEIDADFRGTVRLATPLSASALSLDGELTPDETLLRAAAGSPPRSGAGGQSFGGLQLPEERLQQHSSRALPFQVGGTLSRPTFRLGRG